MADVSRKHGIFVVDLASIQSAPSSQAFATNANAFCESTPLEPGAVDSSALQSAMRAQYARIHAHVLAISGATIDGDTGVKAEFTLTSADGFTFSESQYTVLSKASRVCYVTLATGNRAALGHLFSKIGGTIHVS